MCDEKKHMFASITYKHAIITGFRLDYFDQYFVDNIDEYYLIIHEIEQFFPSFLPHTSSCLRL
jgi:hypothetical protein